MRVGHGNRVSLKKVATDLSPKCLHSPIRPHQGECVSVEILETAWHRPAFDDKWIVPPSAKRFTYANH
jgi:hypothetical protein